MTLFHCANILLNISDQFEMTLVNRRMCTRIKVRKTQTTQTDGYSLKVCARLKSTNAHRLYVSSHFLLPYFVHQGILRRRRIQFLTRQQLKGIFNINTLSNTVQACKFQIFINTYEYQLLVTRHCAIPIMYYKQLIMYSV